MKNAINECKVVLPPIDSSGMALGSLEVTSLGRLNVFNLFMLRRINYTFEMKMKIH